MRPVIAAILTLAVFVAGGAVVSGAGDLPVSCAASRFGGTATMAIYKDHTTVEAADGFPIVSVRNGVAVVRCHGPALRAAGAARAVFQCSYTLRLHGRVTVRNVKLNGTAYVQMAQSRKPFFRIALDGRDLVNGPGCPPPPPPHHGAASLSAITSIVSDRDVAVRPF